MTEEQARVWVAERFGAERAKRLDRFGALLREESAHQNLISAASFDTLWTRHFVDSAQLISHAADAGDGAWLDVGTGAGMPGMVVALLLDRPVIMVEPRARRAEFLTRVASAFGITTQVHACKIEAFAIDRPAAIVSARAVAALSDLFKSAEHCTDSSTVWLLPKGRSAQSEVEATRAKWQGVFHVEPSITQPESGIVIARKVRPK
jgi:16S rRNA (guanine527-N7)-methyltransferase